MAGIVAFAGSSYIWGGVVSAAPRVPCPVRRHVVMFASRIQDNDEDSGSAVLDFEGTSAPVKTIVGGLTAVFNALNVAEQGDIAATGVEQKPAWTPDDLLEGIRRDYERQYLWNGDINEDLYQETCSFKDPTLSFQGVSTFRRNVEGLQGVVNALVVDSGVDLYSATLLPEDSCVCTRWRMYGKLRLPWSPAIDVVGRTRFTYDPQLGNRIISYDEEWEIEPAQALLQILRPARQQ